MDVAGPLQKETETSRIWHWGPAEDEKSETKLRMHFREEHAAVLEVKDTDQTVIFGESEEQVLVVLISRNTGREQHSQSSGGTQELTTLAPQTGCTS